MQIALLILMNLKTIIIPDTVTNMGTSVFSECTNLQKVHLPNIRRNITDSTFYNCTSLSEVNFPDTLETIGDSAFYNCKSLTEVNIPAKVNTINKNAFSGCTSLIKVTISESVTTIKSGAFSHCESLKELDMANGVVTIGEKAFEYNKALPKVKLSYALKELGNNAFQYCDALSEVDFGSALKVIPKYCFYENPELTTVILPQQVTQINDYAFANCTKFTDITINRNVSTIAANAFSYPDKLTIHGIKGTYAEEFASKNNIAFEELNKPATDLIVNNKTGCNLAKGATLQMLAVVTPVDSSDELTWVSTNEGVATVDQKTGLVKALGLGNTQIIAMVGSVTKTYDITVYKGVNGVRINVNSKELGVDDTLQLTANISPNDATNKNVSWISSNEGVASVDDNGLVTAKALGSADITVRTEDGGYEKTCSIIVKEIAVTGVSLNVKTATIGINKTYKLTETIEPNNAANKEVTWTSSKPEVATVEEGVVTGISEGQTTIIVKTVDGSKTATCVITVSKDAVDNPGGDEQPDNPGDDDPTNIPGGGDNPGGQSGTGEQGDNPGGNENQGGNSGQSGTTPGGNQQPSTPDGSGQPSVNPGAEGQQPATNPSQGRQQQTTTTQPQTQTYPGTQQGSTVTPQTPVPVDVTPALAGVKGFSAKNKKGKKLVLSWKWQDGIDKYEIQYALNKKFTKSKKNKKAAGYLDSFTIKKLKKGKTYFVRIRAYKKESGLNLYSEWSKVKKVKIKK